VTTPFRCSTTLLMLPLLLAGLAACRSEKPVPPLKVDACTLFTEQDAREVAGDTIAAMASTLDEAVGRDPGQCIYNSGTLEQPRILSLLIRQFPTRESAKRVHENSPSTLASMSGGQVQDVPGLGEGALWVGGRLQQLHVLRGAVHLVITVQSPDGTDQLKPARAIAEKALARLGKVSPGR
jgi:hypothetical protein